jgi:hypothetical protein
MLSRTLHTLGRPLLAAGVALLLVASSTARAGNPGDPFLLGKSNSVDGTTSLWGTTAGPQLDVLNLDTSHPAIQAEGWYGGIAVYGQHVSTTGTAPAIRADSASTTTNATALYALLSSTNAVVGSVAVRGQNNGNSTSGVGVYGSQAGFGIGTEGFTPWGRGVYGVSNTGTGVWGDSGSGRGVRGQSANGTGVYGAHTAYGGTDPGVYGKTVSPSNGAVGVEGVIGSSSGHYAAGVYGLNSGPWIDSIGVRGDSPSGAGVYGLSSSGDGVYGKSSSGYAGFFDGRIVATNGCVGCGGPSLMIDDPLDPAHRYLQHSTVESPDMLDVYSGTVTTDRKGFAVVELPEYFQALNGGFRYQLTVVGRSFARAIVWSRIVHDRFTIRTDVPGVEVSWQVTGVRHDPYAKAHPIKVIETKPATEQGKYLHPELYGKPRSAAIGHSPSQ